MEEVIKCREFMATADLDFLNGKSILSNNNCGGIVVNPENEMVGDPSVVTSHFNCLAVV